MHYKQNKFIKLDRMKSIINKGKNNFNKIDHVKIRKKCRNF